MMKKELKTTYLILGASFAGFSCASKLKEIEPNCELLIVDKNSQICYLPNGLNYYYRHQLDDLEQAIGTLKSDYLDKDDFLEATAEKILPEEKSVIVRKNDGEILTIYYNYLICAMGASADSLYIKGTDFKKVVTTKYYQNSQVAKKYLSDAKRILIVGGGPIGLDMAYSLTLQKKKLP
ncbi:hypothetical protein HMPREF9318_01293 [Streptococcus urinalis FB127-CNA-2]|uniref:Pyridine nucleotide-disulfide oxidoreductase n=1 Tax=Streptococcus urinalis 2285-97 TaxID=764291 RepID=G5KCM2_9STRE|nr:FAD/NAD(P)-binding oxidoreductase [Streptococcus urinalis]EHJ57653.1 pyridine nucleotide-disulfide oxidoreductase [Streptococcus urinalis 2285-97]EKS19771.1 hypothetical protein HMPREF9318_01293 [Streptococcus urinalis FB127-CNA-2]VEF31348.1 NADH peroxidase [Streptococcus urinalis]